MSDIKVRRIVHEGYKEWIEHRNYWKKVPQLFGKYQYIYSSKKGTISLVRLYTHWGRALPVWEAAWIRNPMEVIGVWKTKKDAENKIMKLLGGIR
jgi:hypothetical protein